MPACANSTRSNGWRSPSSASASPCPGRRRWDRVASAGRPSWVTWSSPRATSSSATETASSPSPPPEWTRCSPRATPAPPRRPTTSSDCRPGRRRSTCSASTRRPSSAALRDRDAAQDVVHDRDRASPPEVRAEHDVQAEGAAAHREELLRTALAVEQPLQTGGAHVVDRQAGYAGAGEQRRAGARPAVLEEDDQQVGVGHLLDGATAVVAGARRKGEAGDVQHRVGVVLEGAG